MLDINDRIRFGYPHYLKQNVFGEMLCATTGIVPSQKLTLILRLEKQCHPNHVCL